MNTVRDELQTPPADRIPEWTLFDRLRKAREDAGLNQQQMADNLGVARATISAWERGRHLGAENLIDVVSSWATTTGVAPHWILGLDSPEDWQQFKLLRKTLRVVHGGGGQRHLPGLGPALEIHRGDN